MKTEKAMIVIKQVIGYFTDRKFRKNIHAINNKATAIEGIAHQINLLWVFLIIKTHTMIFVFPSLVQVKDGKIANNII